MCLASKYLFKCSQASRMEESVGSQILSLVEHCLTHRLLLTLIETQHRRESVGRVNHWEWHIYTAALSIVLWHFCFCRIWSQRFCCTYDLEDVLSLQALLNHGLSKYRTQSRHSLQQGTQWLTFLDHEIGQISSVLHDDMWVQNKGVQRNSSLQTSNLASAEGTFTRAEPKENSMPSCTLFTVWFQETAPSWWEVPAIMHPEVLCFQLFQWTRCVLLRALHSPGHSLPRARLQTQRIERFSFIYLFIYLFATLSRIKSL